MIRKLFIVAGLVGVIATVTPAAAGTDPPLFNAKYSGYSTTYHHRYTDVSATWHVPTLDCAHSSLVSGATQWIGLGGISGQHPPRPGTPLVQTGILTGCVAHQQVSRAFWEVVPGAPPTWYPFRYAANPGNLITALVKYLGDGNYALHVTDVTAGWQLVDSRISTGVNSVPTTAEWIIEPGDLTGTVLGHTFSFTYPLAHFSPVDFYDIEYSTAAGSVFLGGAGSVPPVRLEEGTAQHPRTCVSPVSGHFSVTYGPCSAPAPAPQVPTITSVGTYTQGELVYFDIHYADPGHDAQGFGFVGVNGSGWAEENHPFSSPSYGIVGPDSIAYPFNEACGTPQQYDSYVKAWIYDTAGQRSTPVVIHLVCAGSGGSAG
jgi:Peptidase A4 family